MQLAVPTRKRRSAGWCQDQQIAAVEPKPLADAEQLDVRPALSSKLDLILAFDEQEPARVEHAIRLAHALPIGRDNVGMVPPPRILSMQAIPIAGLMIAWVVSRHNRPPPLLVHERLLPSAERPEPVLQCMFISGQVSPHQLHSDKIRRFVPGTPARTAPGRPPVRPSGHWPVPAPGPPDRPGATSGALAGLGTRPDRPGGGMAR